MKIPFDFDFETGCALDLKQVGAFKYCKHESSRVTLLTYSFGDHGDVKYWLPGTKLPEELKDVIANPHKYMMCAQNVEFDFLVWCLVFPKHLPVGITLTIPKVQDLEDLMALGNYFRIASSLENMAIMLNLPLRKHPEGALVMKKLMRPMKDGTWYKPTPQELAHFIQYGVDDTRLLKMIRLRLPKLPPLEREIWEWTFTRNIRGVRVDVALINELHSIVTEHKPALEKRFSDIVGGFSTGSHAKVLAFFKPYYPYMENTQADTIRDMLADPRPVPPHVREALELKELATSSAIAKIEYAVRTMYNGRVYGLYDYSKAQTQRHAGKGIQPQNFPRPEDEKKQVDVIDFDLNVHDLASIVRMRRPFLKAPIHFVKNLLRRIWLPEYGTELYCGDFSKIEPTVLFWLLDMGEIPAKWYEEMAAEIYNMKLSDVAKDGVERQVGKTAQLSCGYGAGWESFKKKTYKDTGIMLSDEDAKKTVNAYRRKYPQITQLWKDLERGFRSAIYGQTTTLCNGRITFMPMGGDWKGVRIRLPSGAFLYYHEAREVRQLVKETRVDIIDGVKYEREVEEWKTSLAYTVVEMGRKRTKFVYGGLLCENVVSATARHVLVPSMLRLERSGHFEVSGTVHDELWAFAMKGLDELFEKLMCEAPSWATGMSIKVESKIGVRYLK